MKGPWSMTGLIMLLLPALCQAMAEEEEMDLILFGKGKDINKREAGALFDDIVDEATNEEEERSKREAEQQPREKRRAVKKIYSIKGEEKRYARPQRVLENISNRIRKRFAGQFNNDAIENWLSRINILERDNEVSNKREKRVVCPYTFYLCKHDDILYRRMDGSCNNLMHPLWGQAGTPFRRLQKPAYYRDLITYRLYEPRRARGFGGKQLPSAREVVRQIHKHTEKFIAAKNRASSLTMYWGQFVNHDMSNTAMTTIKDKVTGMDVMINCATEDCKGKDNNPNCIPIIVSDAEDSHSFKGFKCIPFVRSQGVINIECQSGAREQLNTVTPWIDGSAVYGTSEQDKKLLVDNAASPAALSGALMKESKPAGQSRSYLPLDDEEKCGDAQCSLAGDPRADMESGLTSLHTLFIREHNRIARALHAIDPKNQGNALFLKTRKIVAAIIQHITYKHYLPMIFGSVPFPGTKLMDTGYFTGYDKEADPRITNVFAAAANRMGHSQVPSRVWSVTSDFSGIAFPTLFMNATWFTPSLLYKDGKNTALNFAGHLIQEAYEVDRFFTDKITQKLFIEHAVSNGLPVFGDLASRNIQRGRDHGIAGYTSWRKFCGLDTPTSFDDLALSKFFGSKEVSDLFKKIYNHVDDIDLFSGGVSEQHLGDGQLGPTFACIIGRQYAALRKGDSFWYENPGPQGFTEDQLAEIRKVTLSKLICNNDDFTDYVANAFKSFFAPNNQPVKCSTFLDMDLTKFADV